MKATFEKMYTKPETLCVRALSVYTQREIKGWVYYVIEYDDFVVRDIESRRCITVNPSTICRNSCIKDKNGIYVYEYDLLKLTHGIKTSCYGFLVWDEFYKSWKIRRRADRTAYCNIDDWTIEVVGNVVLSNEDAEIIYKQEKEEDAEEKVIDNSYCPSKFRR